MCRNLALAVALAFTPLGAWAQLPAVITSGPSYENAPAGCIDIPKALRAHNTPAALCGWCSIRTICAYLDVPGSDGIVEEMRGRHNYCDPVIADRVMCERKIPHLIGSASDDELKGMLKSGIEAKHLRHTSIGDLRTLIGKGIPAAISLWHNTHIVTLVGITAAGDLWVIDSNSTNYKQITANEWDGWAIAIVPKQREGNARLGVPGTDFQSAGRSREGTGSSHSWPWERTSAADGQHRMTIQNGNHREEIMFSRLPDTAAAIESAEAQSHRLASDQAWDHCQQGDICRDRRHYSQASKEYCQAIRLDPKFAPAYAKLAWLLATCPDARLRDGQRAIELATKACIISDWRWPWNVSVLAAAYAEVERFDDAIKYETKALEDPSLLGAAGNPYRARLELYRQHKPFRHDP
jgi:hypothetical protein